MALVRERRQLNLRLPLSELSERRPRFPLPFPPSTTSTATTNTTTCISSSLTDYEKLQVLGHGSGGTVYKVKHKKTATIYALKVVKGDSNPDIRRQIFREISILRQTDSPHIVKCYGVFEKPCGDIGILMEYMDQGTLETQIKKSSKIPIFSETKISKIAKQILQGLEHLHAHKIVHRDIKPANLLVNNEMEVKIADFGVSKMMMKSLEPCNSYVGTCAYMSPERFDPDSYGSGGGNYNGYAADIWSLGLTLLELYMGHFPLLTAGQRPDWATLMCAICFGDPPSLPETISEEFKDFVSCCLQKDSSKRLSASDLLLHPFVMTNVNIIST